MQNAGSGGFYTEAYGVGRLTFRKGDVVVMISGMVEKEEMVRIAESMS
jgi:hypothetical protein